MNVEELVQDIHTRFEALSAQTDEARIAKIVKDTIGGLTDDDPFVRKMRFGTDDGDARLIGSKFARWGYTQADVEFLYDLMRASQGKRTNEGAHPGPSTELTRSFEAVSKAYYMTDAQIREIDRQAIDELYPRVPKHELRGMNREQWVEAQLRASSMDSGTSGYGSQLVGAQYVGNLWDAAFQEGRIAPLIPTFEMTAPTAYLPVAVDMPTDKACCNAAKVERIAPLLRSGFEAAAKEAKTKATEAKGAWKAVTAETYGDVKAKTWAAPVPDFSQANFDAATAGAAAAAEGVAKAQQALGAIQAAERTRAEAQARIGALRETAALLERRRDKLARDETALKAAQDELDAAAAKAGGGPRVGLVHDLARSVNALLVLGAVDIDSVVGVDAYAALAAYNIQHGKIDAAEGDSQAQARIPPLSAARDLLASAVRNSMRDVKASEEAASQVQLLEQQIASAGRADTAALDIARQQLATAQAERKTCTEAIDKLRTAKAAAEGAAQKTAQAAKHHADVEGWDAIAQALAPDGIPAELLSAALGPINARLAQSAADAQWPKVEIGADMGITYGGRQYGLISESEQWRADAMVAEAIASQSNWRLLLLDRFDVLDLQGRSDLIAWLDVLADAGEVDSVFLFGTLKAEPTGLPASIGTHWIDSGMAAQPLKEAA